MPRRFAHPRSIPARAGEPVPKDMLDKLPDSAIITEEISNRGSKDKRVVRYKYIEDYLDNELESKKLAPT